METVVAKWGNSLAVRIPSDAAAKAAFRQGDKVTISQDPDHPGRLIVEPVRRDVDFEMLYAAISPENRHSEVDCGSAVGQEVVEW
jgi:antitoxin MazE